MELCDHLYINLLDLLLVLNLLVGLVDEPIIKQLGVAEYFR